MRGWYSMQSEYKNAKQISTISRKAYEHIKERHNTLLADAVFLCSPGTGRSIIIDYFLAEITRQLEMDASIEAIRDTIWRAETLLGIHEKINTVMVTELGLFGAMVPLDFGKERMTFVDFCDANFTRICYAGSHTIIKGGKGKGKTNLAGALAHYSRKRGFVVAMNIPLVTTEEGYEDVHEIYMMSELLQLRLETPFNIPILLIIDEAEPLWKRILGNTREHRHLNDFENLTRHFNIAMVSIWHYKRDLPDILLTQIEDEDATMIVKDRKETALTSGIVGCQIVDIPKSPIPYLSEGETSMGTFHMDVDIKKALQTTMGIKDNEKARAVLAAALQDQTILLDDYAEELESSKPLSLVMVEILEDFPSYVSPTGKTIDWRAIKEKKNLGENPAKHVKAELLRHLQQHEWDGNLKDVPDDILEAVKAELEL
jgi:hypothetical protein